ncbi:hypothetical protein BpHYR1_027754 [Brachionus plicatilis]|uniref:Uncharacterized protein n=1 Tax=Brachionus plicatilis TaxID=10195 RepID=A0A3M7R3S4_BRAPC|nr:hypothetical protein BpHYR1_027754 [Brachionus plicatilis]
MELEVSDQFLMLKMTKSILVNFSMYSKLTAVADDGKLLRSVYKQHLTKSNPFSLPPQLYRKKLLLLRV